VRAALAPTLCAALALALLPAAAPAAQASHRRTPIHHVPPPVGIPVSVSLEEEEEAELAQPVPNNFLGLSFEVGSLPQIAGYASDGNLVALLRSLGKGVLRFGGVTADEDVAWADETTPRPSWASELLEPGDFRELAGLANNSGWRVLLTIGFGHYEPEAAAREAAAAQAILGPTLEAIELGNEPDSYARHGLRSKPWTSVQYQEQVAGYRNAIDAFAPFIPLAGPDTSGSSAYESWGLGEVVDQKPALLTGHHYPLGCNKQPPPSISLLLSPQIRQAEEVSLRRYLLVAHESELPFRLDETGSVSCGGVPGISDTFASALWALSYTTRAMSMGAAGINFEGNPLNCAGYTPLCARSPTAAAIGELHAQPEWYALLLAKALIGERPLHTIVDSPWQPNVVVSAFLAPDGALHFVLIDDDPPGALPAAVALHVGTGFHGATVLSLTAPSPEALTGVRLGDRAVSSDGEWTQPATLPRAPNSHGVVTVLVPPSSAALVTVSPRG